MPLFSPRSLLASLIACAVVPVAAAPYSRIIAFGDSLTDVGQLPDPGSPIVEVGDSLLPTAGLRLTNRVGPTYLPTEPTGDIAIQHVSRALGLGEIRPSSPLLPGALSGEFAGSSYARAGALSSEILASITAEGGATVSYGDSLETYRDGYLIENSRADSQALYYLNGGANDFLQGGVNDPQGAAAVAANLADGVNALSEAGAKYIMVSNMPDLGATPLAWALGQSNPAAPTGLTQISTLFNQSLYQELDSTNANVVVLDTEGLLTHVRADPQRYGFEAINTCFDNSRDGSSCIADPDHGLAGVSPNPDVMIFNDDVHPTARAQSLIADYTLSVLNAPADIALLPILGLELIHADLQFQQTMVEGARKLSTSKNWQSSLSVSGSDHTINNSLYDTRYKGDSERFALNIQREMNKNWHTGGNLIVSRGEFQSETSASRINIENATASLFMLFNDGRYRSSGSLSYTFLRYADLYRHSPLGPLDNRFDTGDTEGSALNAHLTTSYDISFTGGQWEYGPHIDVLATRLEVDDYNDSPGSVTALAVDSQKWDSLRVNLATYARYSSEDNTVSVTGKIGLMNEHGINSEDVGLRMQSLDVDSGYLPGYKASSKSAVAAQANITYSPNGLTSLSLAYHSISGEHEQQSVALGMSLRF